VLLVALRVNTCLDQSTPLRLLTELCGGTEALSRFLWTGQGSRNEDEREDEDEGADGGEDEESKSNSTGVARRGRNTLLHAAVQYKNLAAVRYIVTELGGREHLDDLTEQGLTALCLAGPASRLDAPIARFLLNAGSSIRLALPLFADDLPDDTTVSLCLEMLAHSPAQDRRVLDETVHNTQRFLRLDGPISADNLHLWGARPHSQFIQQLVRLGAVPRHIAVAVKVPQENAPGFLYLKDMVERELWDRHGPHLTTVVLRIMSSIFGHRRLYERGIAGMISQFLRPNYRQRNRADNPRRMF
jgi:hypothetical protein